VSVVHNAAVTEQLIADRDTASCGAPPGSAATRH
jgi:hypothetical protein